MKYSKNAVVCLILALFLFNCGGSFNIGKRKPAKAVVKGPVPVEVFFEKPENLKYEELGMVSVSMEDPKYNWIKKIEELQKKAKSIGANAIIIANQENNTETSTNHKELTGIAIKITDRVYFLKAWINRII